MDAHVLLRLGRFEVARGTAILAETGCWLNNKAKKASAHERPPEKAGRGRPARDDYLLGGYLQGFAGLAVRQARRHLPFSQPRSALQIA
jgi:hypothetical protein